MIENNLPRDASHGIIQTGNTIKTSDGANTPKTSPLTLSAGVNIITVPDNAVEFIVNPTSASLRVSEVANVSTYDVVAQNTKESIPCAGMSFIYIEGANGNIVNFRFTIV